MPEFSNVGTLPYMSPEHASGKPVDARSDIFCGTATRYAIHHRAGAREGAGWGGGSPAQVYDHIAHSERTCGEDYAERAIAFVFT